MGWLHDLWNSIEGLSWLITKANWGIAASLLFGFACTVLAIKATDKKDSLVAVKESEKDKVLADTNRLAADTYERGARLENDNLKLRSDLNEQTGTVAALRLCTLRPPCT